jgi:hypothetical protein
LGCSAWPNLETGISIATAVRQLEGLLEAGLFQTRADLLRLYRLIATMDAKAPLPTLADQEPTWASASNLSRTWGLNHLADRLDEKLRPP